MSKHKNFLKVTSIAIAISSPIIAAVFYVIIRICNHIGEKRYKREESFVESVAHEVSRKD